MLAERDQETWTAEEVSSALRSSPEMATQALNSLKDNGLLSATFGNANESTEAGKTASIPAYRYAPINQAKAATVLSLKRLYHERRFAILDLIYARPDPNSDIRAFSDAFRIRRAGEDD